MVDPTEEAGGLDEVALELVEAAVVKVETFLGDRDVEMLAPRKKAQLVAQVLVRLHHDRRDATSEADAFLEGIWNAYQGSYEPATGSRGFVRPRGDDDRAGAHPLCVSGG